MEVRASRGVLPVRPSTLRVWRYLQKFYPSDYPSGAVRLPVRTMGWNHTGVCGCSRCLDGFTRV